MSSYYPGRLISVFQSLFFFQAKLFQIKKQQKYFGIVKVIVIMLSSSDDFSVTTPDEAAGKDTDFSRVVSLRNEVRLHITLMKEKNHLLRF